MIVVVVIPKNVHRAFRFTLSETYTTDVVQTWSTQVHRLTALGDSMLYKARRLPASDTIQGSNEYVSRPGIMISIQETADVANFVE
jgi:hypothetical protein